MAFDNAYGAVLGAFVGDAAGAVLEFRGHINQDMVRLNSPGLPQDFNCTRQGMHAGQRGNADAWRRRVQGGIWSNNR